jgi:hypothetical protein
VITPDGSLLFLHSNRLERSNYDIFVSQVSRSTGSFQKPKVLSEPINQFANLANEVRPCLSPDESVLYFTAKRPISGRNTYDLWQASLLDNPWRSNSTIGQDEWEVNTGK